MFGKVPLKETKQVSLAITKNQIQNLKDTCKPTKVPSTINIKKEDVQSGLIKPGKLPEKKENISKSPIIAKREVTSKSIRASKQPPSMMA